MDKLPSTKHEFTCEQAAAFIKRQPAGTTFFVHISIDTPVAGEPGRIFAGGLSSSMKLTRKEALKIAGALRPELEARGARVPITWNDWGKHWGKNGDESRAGVFIG